MPASLSASALSRLLGPWNHGTGPAYRELADVVRLLILDGRVPLDTALPSERSLCAALGVSRTTVTAAYTSLRDQGFLSSGQGSRGKTRIPEHTSFGPALSGPALSGPVLPGQRLAGPLTAPGLNAPGLAAPEGMIDLAYSALPASGEVVHRAFAAALTELPALLPGFGYDALGLLPLRQAIADRYSSA
ncbi:MAG: GntR family transcriptional regulator, partial [Pseudarthrobacter sp.]|nr:GntR family transcriptional regulator [Pseudarthrobacter sp.]